MQYVTINYHNASIWGWKMFAQSQDPISRALDEYKAALNALPVDSLLYQQKEALLQKRIQQAAQLEESEKAAFIGLLKDATDLIKSIKNYNAAVIGMSDFNDEALFEHFRQQGGETAVSQLGNFKGRASEGYLAINQLAHEILNNEFPEHEDIKDIKDFVGAASAVIKAPRDEQAVSMLITQVTQVKNKHGQQPNWNPIIGAGLIIVGIALGLAGILYPPLLAILMVPALGCLVGGILLMDEKPEVTHKERVANSATSSLYSLAQQAQELLTNVSSATRGQKQGMQKEEMDEKSELQEPLLARSKKR